MKQETSKLQVIAKEQNLSPQDLQKLTEAFGGPFNEVGAILDDYKLDDKGDIIKSDNVIVVTDVNDKEGMDKARKARLLLKKARTTVEGKRKELKADIIKQGNAIDAIAKYVKQEIIPVENFLQIQEDYAKTIAEEEKRKAKQARVETLLTYTDDISLYNLDNITDEQFEALVATLKEQHEHKIAEAKRIEQERIEEEKAKEEERARIEEENRKLKAEAEAREKADAEKREAEEKERQLKEREEREEAQRVTEIRTKLKLFAHNVQTVNDCDRALVELNSYFNALDATDQANERLESAYTLSVADLKEAKAYITEENEKLLRQKEQQLQEEKNRQELLAPDKDKLRSFAKGLDIVRKEKMPAVKTKQAQDILNEVELQLSKIYNYIMDKAENI